MRHIKSIHLQFGYLNPCTKLFGSAKIGYELGLLVHGNLVVEFCGEVFLVDCVL